MLRQHNYNKDYYREIPREQLTTHLKSFKNKTKEREKMEEECIEITEMDRDVYIKGQNRVYPLGLIKESP